MPLRHEGDQRIEIGDWDTWIEKELADARERGEFDNLPTAGKPLEFTTTDVNQQWDLAFSRMKNAGVMPAWMELDQTCHAQRAELNAFLDRSARYLTDQIDRLDDAASVRPPNSVPAVPRWQVWKRVAAWLQLPDERAPDEHPLDRLDLLHMRATMREQYLARAAELDKSIVEFNDVLPRTLAHLERMRMLPGRAGRLFERGCPLIPEKP